jgi:hypothetical protein
MFLFRMCSYEPVGPWNTDHDDAVNKNSHCRSVLVDVQRDGHGVRARIRVNLPLSPRRVACPTQ